MKKLIFAVCVFSLICSQADAQSRRVRVDVVSNAPTGGVALTPLWVGFHDGSFDSYNGGLSSQVGLERLAEDGDASVISADFLGGYTYVDDGMSNRVLTGQTVGRVDGVLAAANGTPPPIQPGESTSAVFDIDVTENQYFSYASMVLPSNDFYVANGNPTQWDLSSILDGSGSITFDIGLPGTVNDAGTEVNDFSTSAANGLFGLAGGQTGPNQGADEFGVNANVLGSPFADFLNLPDGQDLSLLDFNNSTLYSNGIATVTITAVPEPGSLGLLTAVLCGLSLSRRRR